MSYIDNIDLVASSKSIKKNYKILKEAAIRIFEKGVDNLIQFNPEKTELIHFHSKRSAGMAQWLRRLARKPARDLASSAGCVFETHS